MKRTRLTATFFLAVLLVSTNVNAENSLSLDDVSDSLEPVVVGNVKSLEVFPPAVSLSGSRQQAQLIVSGIYDGQSSQDLTRAAKFASTNEKVATVDGGVVRPVGDGAAEIVISAGGAKTTVKVEVSGQSQVEPVSFLYGALAALSKQGCNSGACHGSPSGKGGFRLSLRAFDAELDKLTLIREAHGRRVNPLNPDASLLLAKPMMRIPHGGGLKLTSRDTAYTTLKNWIAEGCRVDAADAPRLVGLQVSPSSSGREYHWPAHTQQLCVQARFSDGSTKDVTPLAVYSSSDEQVAEVTRSGLVVGRRRGEAAIIIRFKEFVETVFLTFVKDVPGFAWKEQPQNNYIDELVDAKLEQLQYLPSGVCTDDEFLRRVYLDVIGILPTIEETQAFLNDPSTDKRRRVIDKLLDRPEWSQFWALKWGDLLRMTSKSIGADGMHKYHRWLKRSFDENMPYDEFAEALLTSSGSTHSNPTANFYRAATDTNDCVESISQLFLGARLQCAKCHNHPFERWTQDNYYGMAAFFNRVQRTKTGRGDEMLVWMSRSGEVTQPRTGQKMKPWLPEAGEVEVASDEDRRIAFAEWLTKTGNPFFAKVEANRIWSHVFGRGIVDPPDDFRDSNPPSNAALLEALATDFAESGFDRKHILRTILNSRTYQASAQTNEFNKDDEKYFSHCQPRLLGAEQLLDAICHVTGAPESFKGLPGDVKATQLPAPELANSEFLKVFGQPERQTVCQCERSTDSNLGQALQLFNGPLVHQKLQASSNRFRKMISNGKTNEEIIDQLYQAAFCRPPSPTELKASLNHIASKEKREEALEDVCWAIINTNEFLFQH